MPLSKDKDAFMQELAALVEKYNVKIYAVANKNVGLIGIVDKTTHEDVFFGDSLMEKLEGISKTT